MFDDIIAPDENVVLKSIASTLPDLQSWHASLTTRLEQVLSKHSEVFQYNYGRLNGIVPERTTHFSHAYPKKATNLDTDHHHLSFDTEILTRWIPRDVLKLFVPVLYFQDLQKERRAEALTAKSVPTAQELHLCASLRGKGYWKRDGTWLCTTRNLKLEFDQYGPRYFFTYNDWIAWESNIQAQINAAKLAEDWSLVRTLREVKASSK